MIIETVRESWSRVQADGGPGRCVIGVSGGVDSMVLLQVLFELGLPVEVAHVNYHRRGGASQADQELVQATAEGLSLPFHLHDARWPDGTGNFQDWARRERYHFFGRIAESVSSPLIVTAHQRDDQVETVLFKLLRGAGLSAWQGMREWDGRYWRPLLRVTRREILTFAEARGISYREDQSNLGSDYARNFLRNELSAALNEHVPGWQDNVLRLPGQARLFEQSLSVIDAQLRSGPLAWQAGGLLDLPSGFCAAFLRHLVLSHVPGAHPPSRGELENAVQALSGLETGAFVALTGRLELWRDRDDFVLRDLKEHSRDDPVLVLSRESLEGEPAVIDGWHVTIDQEWPRRYGRKLYLDARAVRWPLTLRRWQPGDRIQPLGMRGHQLVSDVLTNRKVPAAEKSDALVVVSFDETVCAVIFGPLSEQGPGVISERVRCPGHPVPAITIEYHEV